jgi:hypothetical protein
LHDQLLLSSWITYVYLNAIRYLRS